MKKRLLSVILGLIVTLAGIYAISFVTKPTLRWMAIFVIMFFGILLASLILEEEPMEVFDNFSEWRRAKLSSVMMIIATISLIAAFVNFVQNFKK